MWCKTGDRSLPLCFAIRVQHIAAVMHDLPCRSNPSSRGAQKTPTQGKVMYTHEAQTNAVAAQTKCVEGAAPSCTNLLLPRSRGASANLAP